MRLLKVTKEYYLWISIIAQNHTCKCWGLDWIWSGLKSWVPLLTDSLMWSKSASLSFHKIAVRAKQNDVGANATWTIQWCTNVKYYFSLNQYRKKKFNTLTIPSCWLGCKATKFLIHYWAQVFGSSEQYSCNFSVNPKLF